MEDARYDSDQLIGVDVRVSRDISNYGIAKYLIISLDNVIRK